MVGGDRTDILRKDLAIFGEPGSEEESSQRLCIDENRFIERGRPIDDPGASPGEFSVPLQCPGLALKFPGNPLPRSEADMDGTECMMELLAKWAVVWEL